MTRARIVALASLALIPAAAAFAAVAGTGQRVHRLHVPPPPLSTRLTVDEFEWRLSASKKIVQAGTIRIRAYNRGMDDHDLAVRDSDGTVHVVPLAPGAAGTLTVALRPGTYKLFCSLFAGTSESHEDKGMWTEIEAR